MEIAVFTLYPIAEEMGKIVAYQSAPCQSASGACKRDPLARLASEVPVKRCTSQKQEEIEEQANKKWGRIGTSLAVNAVCLDLEDIYIAGEPNTRSEASLIIAFTKHPDIVTDPY